MSKLLKNVIAAFKTERKENRALAKEQITTVLTETSFSKTPVIPAQAGIPFVLLSTARNFQIACKFKPVIAALALLLLCPAAHAKSSPDYLSFGVGGYNFNKRMEKRKSVDYRIEYQSGISLLPLTSEHFKTWDKYVQIHPNIGFEGNSHGSIYANAGINMDVHFLRYGVFTIGESIGIFDRGSDVRSMGSMLEFRSQIELGTQLKNGLRITGFISHISNGWTASDNPGAEIAGAYIRIPLNLSGKK